MSVGKDIIHDSGIAHVTGESVFIDDRPEQRGELHVGLVLAPVACGEVTNIDPSVALKHPDCMGVWTWKDFVHQKWGPIIHDQPFLSNPTIGYMAEPVAIIASTRRETVEEIRRLVKVEAKETPGIFTITEARKAESILYKAATPFVQGDVEAAFKIFVNVNSNGFCLQSEYYCKAAGK